MKRRIITIVIALVVIVAAVCALTLTGGEVTYIKDVDSQKLDEAYKLLNTSYLDKGEEAEVYYTDYIMVNIAFQCNLQPFWKCYTFLL